MVKKRHIKIASECTREETKFPILYNDGFHWDEI